MEAAQDDYFVGRQPILDGNNHIYGYELLFRGGLTTTAEFDSASTATAVVIRNAMMNVGLNELVGNAKAFINFPEAFFLEAQEPIFHHAQTVIEVLEDVRPTEAVITSIQYLKEQGYTIALDDFIFKNRFLPFIQMADIIKFDVEHVSPEKLKPLFDKVKNIAKVIILAERVETKEMFEHCKAAGADLFQGYYFAKPEIVTGKQLGVGKVNLMQLLEKIVDSSLHLDDLEKVIERDVGLSLKILKMAGQYRTAKMPNFSTLKEVLSLFGMKRVQAWATMISLTALDDVIPEVFNLARLRAIFMRNVAQHENLTNVDSFYLAGLFSMLDVIVGQTLEQALSHIPISDGIKEGLLNGTGEYARLLTIAESFEKKKADEFQEYALFYFNALKEVNCLAKA
ncbi:EAL and HDOD domain-containing protein [Thiomicrorhabdus arctica]|uniref:EAL and HDOD domain-containing protein n=1 Tax=Thiomicrorhabdus arctica TaxID=131540 RepID=UPI00037C670C|nr:EAL domain-containing protein [Thiomicrorhabdus arctica]